MNKKNWKVFVLGLLFIAFALAGCSNTDTSTKQEEVSVVQSQSKPDTQGTDSSQAESDMPIPNFEYYDIKNSSQDFSLKITSSFDNVSKIKIYHIEANSENKKSIFQKLVGEFNILEIPNDKIISVNIKNEAESIELSKDNSKIQTDFYCAGYKICYENKNETIWSEFKPYILTIDTGTVNQYDAVFWGNTACGAANGVLILQTVSNAFGQDLINRLNAVRNYSKLSYDYSCGEKIQYCMSGDQIVNSVNTYLHDTGIYDFSIQNFGDLNLDTETIICNMLDSGRPCTVMVEYSNGEILPWSPYSHWITINGYRISESDNSYEFRWENTLLSSGAKWISAKSLNESIQGTIDNTDFSAYGVTKEEVSEICGEIKRDIVGLKDKIINSFC